MRNYVRFDSLVNIVELVNKPKFDKQLTPAIRKTFNKIAIGTNIPLPKDRFIVEQNISIFLQLFLNDNKFIKTPHLLWVDEKNSELWFEYINAPTLLEYIKNNPLPTDLIGELFHVLENLEQLDCAIVNHIFNGHELVTQECGKAQLLYKFNYDINFHTFNCNQLCLGDVSLSNILYDGKHLYLIDFEFGRMFYGSYDRAQLLAQINVLFPDQIDLKSSMQLHGMDSNIWVHHFYKYYARKYGAHC